MRYSFQSIQQNNYKSILHRSVYKLLWPLGLIVLIQVFFPQSKFAKDNWHIYSLLIVEAIQLFLILTSDSINEVAVDTAKKRLEVVYYNIYQGNKEEKHFFAEITTDIETTFKKGADFTIKKDNFSQQDIESLSELLYQITTPKKV
jgi:hypothetical protein